MQPKCRTSKLSHQPEPLSLTYTHIVTAQHIHSQHKCQLYKRILGTPVCACRHPKNFNPCLDESGQLKVEQKSWGKGIKIDLVGKSLLTRLPRGSCTFELRHRKQNASLTKKRPQRTLLPEERKNKWLSLRQDYAVFLKKKKRYRDGEVGGGRGWMKAASKQAKTASPR